MSNAKIELPACPDALQAAVRDKLAEPDCELLSVTRTECTPYKDKSIISGRYRAIVNRMNLVTVLECSDDGALKNMVYENSLIWGDILEIIRTAPTHSSLAIIREELSEKAHRLLSL